MKALEAANAPALFTPSKAMQTGMKEREERLKLLEGKRGAAGERGGQGRGGGQGGGTQGGEGGTRKGGGGGELMGVGL